MAFFSNQFLRDVLFFVVGGVSSVAILKIWENRESLLREIRRRFDSNETRQPEEHDERFDWEGKSSVSYENILWQNNNYLRKTLWYAQTVTSSTATRKMFYNFLLFLQFIAVNFYHFATVARRSKTTIRRGIARVFLSRYFTWMFRMNIQSDH